ncbi:glycosyltransferase [Okeania sp. SIO3I5]|uniref:glycosyltransferase n=1 Tax=Okeania sp. SIO3I5 TaxID=2607805 RepID=UPI0025D112B7|nr:glycosyltransferase [Okeania sp. SIO3I5]
MNNQTDPSLGVNVVGAVTGEYGLGEATRGTLRSMEAAGVPFAVRKVEVGWHRHMDNTYSDFIVDKYPYPINLVHTNPDQGLYNTLGPEYFDGRYNIGYWSWELPTLHPAWEYAFDYFDEIWTLSSFTAEAISTISPIPVVKVMPSIVMPKPTVNRDDLKLPKDKFIFLFMFDFHSTIARKNPYATIKAFKQAFAKSDRENVLLIVKFSNAQYHSEGRDKLKAEAEGLPSIQFIDGHILKKELIGLFNSCDCYVSLHRAEGFGLTMAETMYYGKPVISTGYSSNIEFMNVGNSFLVKYKLVTITESEGPYFQGSIWAEPDVDHAAYLMRYVFDNYQEAQQVGARAAKEIRTILSPETIGKRIRNRVEYIAQRIEDGKYPNRLAKLQKLAQETNGIKNQIKAWKKTAIQMQKELN